MGDSLDEKWVKTPVDKIKYLYWTIFPYQLRNAMNPKTWYYETKYFIQRGRRGWSDRDWWNADYYLTRTIPPMLRKLAVGNSYPGLPPYDTAKKWAKACNKAADDIEAFSEHEKLDFPKKKKAQKKYFDDSLAAQKRTRLGMKWVADNFLSLWD